MANAGWPAGRNTVDEQAEQPDSCRCSHPAFWHDHRGGPCQRISCGCREYRPRETVRPWRDGRPVPIYTPHGAEQDELLYAMAHSLAGNHEQQRAEAELTSGRQTSPPTTLDPSTP